MIRAGFETTHPITGIRTILVEGAEETNGRGWTIEVHTPPGAVSMLPEHYHWTWTETFEILEGRARCSVGGIERTLHAGQSIVMEPKMRHVHPHNIGRGALVYRQTDDFGGVDRSAVHDILGVAATLNGLAGEGKLDATGRPRHLLQFAATLRALVRHGGFDGEGAVAVQLAVSATLGPFATERCAPAWTLGGVFAPMFV